MNAKPIAFRVFAALAALALAATLAEGILRLQRQRIERSDEVDPGLVRYDPDLGWTLTPNWKGEHRHHDFTARYTIDDRGCRLDSGRGAESGARLRAVVGDSFSFGLGAHDEETFVHRLNAMAGKETRYVNFAVPGYSTDQELLLLERAVLPLDPEAVVLVVYLGNDFFDNQLAFPIQGNHGKPFFELDGGKLALRNTPVAIREKSAEEARRDLSSFVPGAGRGDQWWRRLALGALMDDAFGRDAVPAEAFSARFDPAFDLFAAILGRIQAVCDKRNAKLVMVLLAGRSFVEKPDSLSAKYQDALRLGVTRRFAAGRPSVIDAAAWMRGRYASDRKRWFFPNDGHLNAMGHAELAGFLRDELAKALDPAVDRR